MATQRVAGVWKRSWEEDPLGDAGGADRDTLVLWTQSPLSGLYVDVRLPRVSPGRSLSEANAAGYKPTPSALEARGGFSVSMENPSRLTREQVGALFRQKSFAGQLQYAVGDTTSGEALAKDAALTRLADESKDNGALGLCTCFWRRDIDYQPPSGSLDVGVCCALAPPDADGVMDMRETGDDGSYAELWHRLPGTAGGPSFALKLLSESDVQRAGFWVRAGNHFAYAIGRPKESGLAKKLGCHEDCASIEKAVGKGLAEAVEYIVGDDLSNQTQIVGSYIGLHGVVSESGSWTILHSTNPCLVGCTLVGSESDQLCCSTLSLGGKNKTFGVGDILIQTVAGSRGVVRKWEVADVDGSCDLPGLV